MCKYLAKKYVPVMETVDLTHDLFDLCILMEPAMFKRLDAIFQ